MDALLLLYAKERNKRIKDVARYLKNLVQKKYGEKKKIIRPVQHYTYQHQMN